MTSSPSPASLRVAVVVLNYRTWKYTLDCIDALDRQDYPRFDVFVVDNDSPDDSVSQIRGGLALRYGHAEKGDNGVERHDLGADRELFFWKNASNTGYSDGNNVALVRARDSGRYGAYWVLNNDTTFAPDTLSAMVRTLETDPHRRPVGNDIYYYDDPTRLQMAGGLYFSPWSLSVKFAQETSRVEYLSGASFLVDDAFLRRWGLLPDQYFLNCEDWEYFLPHYREWKRRMPRGSSPYLYAGRILHKESASQGKGSALSIYYYSRNILYTIRKFYPHLFFPIQANLLAKALVYSLRRDPLAKVILQAWGDYYRGRLGKSHPT